MASEVSSRRTKALQCQLTLLESGLRPKDLCDITGLNSVRIALAIQEGKELPEEATKAVAQLVEGRVRRLFQKPTSQEITAAIKRVALWT